MQKILLYTIFAFITFIGFSQNQEIDSIKTVLETLPADSNKVNTLITLSSYFYRTSPAEAIRYGITANDLAEQIDFQKGAGYAQKSIGMGHYYQGDYANALISWQQALEIFQSIDHKVGEANMLNNLGAVYFNEGQDTKANGYYLQSLKLAEEVGDKLRIATALQNIGSVYYNKPATYHEALRYYYQALPIMMELEDYEAIGAVSVNMGEIFLSDSIPYFSSIYKVDTALYNPDTALYYFEKALDAYQNSKTGNIPYALNSLGKVYVELNDFTNAVNYQKQAIEIAENNNAPLEQAISYTGLGDSYRHFKHYRSAISSYLVALDYSEDLDANYLRKEAYEGLSSCYAELKDYTNAYKYQNLLTTIKDTLYNIDRDKDMQALTLFSEIDRKQNQIGLLTKDKELQELDIRRQKTMRNATGIVGFLLLLLAIGLFGRYRYTRKTSRIIAAEKERSDNLLLNILPEEIAEELKENGKASPKHYDTVSVLFTDFKGFTKIAEKLTPQQLVEELNHCFLEFDFIIDEFNLEKIKTIGDAYMCAGGIPIKNTTNPDDRKMVRNF